MISESLHLLRVHVTVELHSDLLVEIQVAAKHVLTLL